jgi:hypothetical protein
LKTRLNDARLLGILGIGYIILLALEAITVKEAIELTVLTALVFATLLYAKRTAEIASATKEQADEIREQRLSEARPYLLLRLKLDVGEIFLQWDSYKSSPPREEIPITITNAGKGPAINLYTALWHEEKTYFIGGIKGYLAPGEKWDVSVSRTNAGIEESEGWLPELTEVIGKYEAGIIAVEYEDIHHRAWVSYLELERHVDIQEYVEEGKQNIVEIRKNND